MCAALPLNSILAQNDLKVWVDKEEFSDVHTKMLLQLIVNTCYKYKTVLVSVEVRTTGDLFAVLCGIRHCFYFAIFALHCLLVFPIFLLFDQYFEITVLGSPKLQWFSLVSHCSRHSVKHLQSTCLVHGMQVGKFPCSVCAASLWLDGCSKLCTQCTRWHNSNIHELCSVDVVISDGRSGLVIPCMEQCACTLADQTSGFFQV